MERVLPTVRREAESKHQIVCDLLVMHDLCQFYEAEVTPRYNTHQEEQLRIEAPSGCLLVNYSWMLGAETVFLDFLSTVCKIQCFSFTARNNAGYSFLKNC